MSAASVSQLHFSSLNGVNLRGNTGNTGKIIANNNSSDVENAPAQPSRSADEQYGHLYTAGRSASASFHTTVAATATTSHLSLSSSLGPTHHCSYPSRSVQYCPFPYPNLPRLPPRTSFPVNRYSMVRTLRNTLFGRIVLYRDAIMHRLVAIKLSDLQLLQSGTTVSGHKLAENPLEELRVMSILSGTLSNVHGVNRDSLPEHVRFGERYVLTSLGDFEDASFLYTVMPFCSKGEFFDHVCNEVRFTEDKANRYFTSMLLGVAYMHGLGLAHLDISLENLLMTEDDQLKICDHGVTRHLAYDNANPPCVLPFAPAENKPGKMGYMAPEIFASHSFSGPMADVWSMGIVLFTMVFGVPPYQIPSLSDQRFALIFRDDIYRLLRAWNMTTVASAGVVDLIQRMLRPEAVRISVDGILLHPWITGKDSRMITTSQRLTVGSGG
jgi:serine/threonine protein kinase